MSDIISRNLITEALRNRPVYEAQCTEREIQYYRARAVGAVPVVAARVAGYEDPAAEAVKLEQNPLIRAATSNERSCMDAEIHVTKHDVIANMMRAAEMALSATDAIIAWREIARIMGYYNHVSGGNSNRNVYDGSVNKPGALASMSEAELKAIAAPTMNDADFTEIKPLESVRKKQSDEQ